MTREKTLFSVIDPCVGALRRKKKLPATPKTFIVAVETAQSEPEIQLAASTARLPLLHKRLPKSARARIAGRGGTRSASANSVRDVRPRNEAHKWSSKSQTAESASDPPGQTKMDAKRRPATTARPSSACRRSTRSTGASRPEGMPQRDSQAQRNREALRLQHNKKETDRGSLSVLPKEKLHRRRQHPRSVPEIQQFQISRRRWRGG